jgi:hypothetical protein
MNPLYKPVGMGVGLAGGMIAGAIFKQVWKRIDDEEDPPTPLQKEFGWRKILLASALQGAIFSVVKAVVARGGAKGVEKVTGAWVGDDGPVAKAA